MSTSTASPTKKATKKVLIIEDEGEMCLLLNIILADKDMELEHVKTLESARTYLKDQRPAVILLDNKLPDGFGVDFVTHIKSNYPGVPVIMISGFNASAKDMALENGADIFLEKPFSKDKLFAAIEKALAPSI